MRLQIFMHLKKKAQIQNIILKYCIILEFVLI